MMLTIFCFRPKQAGFSLLEVVVAMLISSVIFIAMTKTYPVLSGQILDLYRKYRLHYLVNRTVYLVEKDIRRAGYCRERTQCEGAPLVIKNKPTESVNSCIIVAFDLNLNDRWEKPEHIESEFFGYRLNNRLLEWKRGAGDCQENSWERLFDPKEVVIDTFHLEKSQTKGGRVFITLSISAHWLKSPSIVHRHQTTIRLRNIRE
ncbi:prepilin peptidase-dependent protein [Xenorhabdus nematophila]|uniref:Prepilin peptidase-dependent protein B, possibly in type IV pilin biogenesis n=1 Tax=Xenorhabdus nematophila (strain ATCC 19061 / DSM 3370 / CCUG 14189 / LMG 1036 / NCIMB 9965 / AN6) TaxID=406817 RepID=D3VCN1_XENNA|nr:prepilin peptidase-dependent protein [Xenorhabdus nematophila]CEE90786.1 prepilin peptidase-dependent protein B, possibly in type IV pilin biogenesis [Xenorhabdus nematophila str. Anatoliense]CEF28949.1 prepilin peptidase-dependent protein B, possibly in type IV pilin biogenesis [Xenorhabdus nematophila str. Websteri]AYA42122.1 prepilin peptidase-dependent protein [Xenorhabdus nematophila]KHD28852.1 peptidase [Xenorhabdus nematophila]MBA0020845.1 prepilin peptidase-dependent protein [Xenorh